jgi:hypothetical protein
MPFPSRQLLALGLALTSFHAAGQSPPAIPNLRTLTRNSGYIFDGTVLAVGRVAPNDESMVSTVQITFRVEQAMRGTRNGQILTIREWAGLWNSGDRYRPGERLLLFLYSPGKLGLTSPVGGPWGRFAVDSGGNIGSENVASLGLNTVLPRQSQQKNRMSTRALAATIRRADAE